MNVGEEPEGHTVLPRDTSCPHRRDFFFRMTRGCAWYTGIDGAHAKGLFENGSGGGL